MLKEMEQMVKEVQQNLKVAQDWQKKLRRFKTNSKRVQCWRSRISKGKVKEEFFEFGKMFQAGTKVLWTF